MSDFLIQIGCACLIIITAALGVWGPLAILTRAYKSDNKCSIAGSTIDLEQPLLVPASAANTMTVVPAAHLPSYGTIDSVINNDHLRNQDTHFAKQHNEELQQYEKQPKEKDNIQHHTPSLERKAGNELVALPVTRDFLSPVHSRPDEYTHVEHNELEKEHVEVNENNDSNKHDHDDNINQLHTTDALAALTQQAKSTTVTPTHEINEQMPLLLSPSHREYHSLQDNQQTRSLEERAKERKRIRQRRLRRKRLLRRTHPMLSYANYFSAGMLIAMACDHFLPSAFAHASANQTHSVAGWVLMGLLIPAILECSANTEIVSDSNTSGVEDEGKKMTEEKTKPEFYEELEEEQESISPRRYNNKDLEEEEQEKLRRQKRRWSNHSNRSHEAHGHSHLLIQQETSSDEEEEEEEEEYDDNDVDSAIIENNNKNIANENRMTHQNKNNVHNGAEGQTWHSTEKLSVLPRSDSTINATKDKNQAETQELQDKHPFENQKHHHVIIHDNDDGNNKNLLHKATTTAASVTNREKSASASHHVSFQETLKHMSPKELYKHQVALPSFSTATLLITLMCFHAILEGLLLGIEGNSRSLLDVTLPLSLHKFLDGIVIGVSLAKDHQRRVDR